MIIMKYEEFRRAISNSFYYERKTCAVSIVLTGLYDI